MRVDLHCHTKSTKKGDGDGRNVTKDLFVQKVSDADVKIVAITNHNAFDIKQYYELKEAVAGFCQVWPGIEIDIQGKENKYHMIVVANPDNVEQFSKSIEELFNGKDIETCRIAVGEVQTKLNDCDVIYITHLCKTPSITDEEYKELVDLVGDESRVFGEPQNNKSLGVFANHNYNVIIGSDVKNWNEYERSTFAELKLPVESFQQFCLLSKKDATVVETLLNKKQSFELIAKPHSSVRLNIKIYKDVNVIFGQKGTGKSKIVNSLYDSLVQKGVNCSRYTASEKELNFKSLLDNKDMTIDVSLVGADKCEQEFSFICDWKDFNITPISEYVNWYNTRDNNNNKRKMRITDSTTIIQNQPQDFYVHKNDYETIVQVIEKIDTINLDSYIIDDGKKHLLELINILSRSIRNYYISDKTDIIATRLTNFTINTIKNIADRKSDSVSKPSTTGFKEFAMNRVRLKRFVSKIIQNISDKESHVEDYLGEIDGKGKIYISQVHRMLCDSSKTNEFQLGIKALREAKKLLDDILHKLTSSELLNTVDGFKKHCDQHKINSTECFLGRLKRIVTEDGNEYSPSNGEMGILMLQRELNSGADAIFLDEPELGMGNSYINNTICPQIMKLAQSNKLIVIATHNANIAVRCLPYTSIYRTHQNGKYNTYVGNPFNDMLVNIEDKDDVKSWSQESLTTLEGGKEAFYERKYIYESNN